MLKAGHVLRSAALTECDPAVGVGTCRAAAWAWIATAGAATVSPGVFRAICGEGRRYLSGRLRAAGRPGAGCGTPQVIICCSSGGLCLRRRMIGCCLSRSTVRAGFHRAGRRWQRDKPGSLAVIGIALGWVTVGRGEWRPRAGAGVPQRAPGRASYCILRWWGCGLGQARRGHVCGWRRCRAWVLAGRAACGIWRVARSLSRLRRGGLNRGPRSPAPGIGRLWPVRAARRSGRGRGQPGERA
jgi:hypothetical protein